MKELTKLKLQKKIADIKSGLEKEISRYGRIRDKRELRYLPTEFYLRMEEYSAALNYMKWYLKNFPNDKAFPEFLLEWAIIHFKNGNMKEAKYKIFETWCANNYIFDKYFGKDIIPLEKLEKSHKESADYAKLIHHSAGSKKLADFDQWLKGFISSENFINLCKQFTDIRRRLLTEKNPDVRNELTAKEKNLKYKL
jgi:hypothetical protein